MKTPLLCLPLLCACAADKPDDAGETGDPVCAPALPDIHRVDQPSGYRSVLAPVEAPWLDQPRAVPVGLWYATDDPSGEAATYLDLLPDTDSWLDAGLADPAPGCALPLVVYSHGSQAWGGNNSVLFRHMVQQGWIVAAPDHLGNTLTDNEEPRPATFSRTRAADIVATLDAIEALPEGDPLHGRVDTSRVLVLGHSFGGETAWLMSGPTFDPDAIDARCAASELGCTEADRAAYDAPVADPRVVGVMPMDGFAGTDLVAAQGWETAGAPIFYMARSKDGDDEAITVAAAADVTWARFEGACHETFTSSPVFCDGFDRDEGHDIIAQYMASFAAVTVLGAEGEPYEGILDGSTTVDSRVTLRSTR